MNDAECPQDHIRPRRPPCGGQTECHSTTAQVPDTSDAGIPPNHEVYYGGSKDRDAPKARERIGPVVEPAVKRKEGEIRPNKPDLSATLVNGLDNGDGPGCLERSEVEIHAGQFVWAL